MNAFISISPHYVINNYCVQHYWTADISIIVALTSIEGDMEDCHSTVGLKTFSANNTHYSTVIAHVGVSSCDNTCADAPECCSRWCRPELV